MLVAMHLHWAAHNKRESKRENNVFPCLARCLPKGEYNAEKNMTGCANRKCKKSKGVKGIHKKIKALQYKITEQNIPQRFNFHFCMMILLVLLHYRQRNSMYIFKQTLLKM